MLSFFPLYGFGSFVEDHMSIGVQVYSYCFHFVSFILRYDVLVPFLPNCSFSHLCLLWYYCNFLIYRLCVLIGSTHWIQSTNAESTLVSLVVPSFGSDVCYLLQTCAFLYFMFWFGDLMYFNNSPTSSGFPRPYVRSSFSSELEEVCSELIPDL